MKYVSVAPSHGLCLEQRVQRHLFRSLGHGLEEPVDRGPLGPERTLQHHLDGVGGPLLARWYPVRRVERDEDLTAAVVPHRTRAAQPDVHPPREAFQLAGM
jgi:hypothetical protein